MFIYSARISAFLASMLRPAGLNLMTPRITFYASLGHNNLQQAVLYVCPDQKSLAFNHFLCLRSAGYTAVHAI